MIKRIQGLLGKKRSPKPVVIQERRTGVFNGSEKVSFGDTQDPSFMMIKGFIEWRFVRSYPTLNFFEREWIRHFSSEKKDGLGKIGYQIFAVRRGSPDKIFAIFFLTEYVTEQKGWVVTRMSSLVRIGTQNVGLEGGGFRRDLLGNRLIP